MSLLRRKQLSDDEVAALVASQIDKLCVKHKCRVGVWLTWSDLIKNLDALKNNPQVDTLEFGLQIQFNDGAKLSDKDNTGNQSGT